MGRYGSMGWLLVAGACLSAGALGAQETGVTDAGRHGGFGGPVVKLTEIDNRFGVLVGGHGGWIIDGRFTLGGGGYALGNVGNFENLTNGGDPGGLEMAYGGVEFGYVHGPDAVVHIGVGLLLGAGGLTWTPDDASGTEVESSFFVAEPEVDVVINATRFLRIAVGATYRLTGGVDLLDLGNSDLSGLGAVVAFNFGGF